VSLKRLGILHIADLHYGLSEHSRLDKAKISVRLKKDIGPDDPKGIFLGRIPSLAQKHKVDMLAFTGDLGFGDDSMAMEEGIEYLSTLGERLSILPEHVVISPGNHDLDRKNASGKEFALLMEKCTAKKFTVSDRENPACIKINDIPVLSLNTCLGGTEHAFYDMPEVFWDKIREILTNIDVLDETLLSEVPEVIKSQLKMAAMDIPAIGQRQCDHAEKCLSDMDGNFAIIIGHHNPLPTHMIVVRPYAEVIDAGRLIFNLLSNERRIIFLHGHTHCDTALLTRAPGIPDSGLMACIGATGLHTIPGSTSSISFIDVLADDKPDFLCAIVYRYQLQGSNFVQGSPFFVWDEGMRTNKSSISIEKLEAGKTFTVEEIEKELDQGTIDHEKLAIELLRHRMTHQIEIQDVDRDIEDWRIFVNK